MSTHCVSCGDTLVDERAEMGFNYCLRDDCVKANYRPAVYLEIGQTKTNAAYPRVDENTLRDIAEGKYKRDPVVVKRQTTNAPPAKVRGTFKRAAPQPVNRARVRYVQSLADQGLSPDRILERADFMTPRLTRQEVYKYMAGRRI